MTLIKVLVLERWLFCLWKMEKGYISVIKNKRGLFVHILCVQKAYLIWTFIHFQKKIYERCKKVHKRWPLNHLLVCINGVLSCCDRFQQSHLEPGIASDMLRNLQTQVYEVKTLHGCRESSVIPGKRPDFKDFQMQEFLC